MEEVVQACLARIVSSRGFARSGRLCRFLRFIVDQALAGHQEQLKEYVIGVEVFDRPSSYDPRLDPIVRVEARRLRSKLRKYYETEGLTDPLRVELPAPGYVPRFGDGAVQAVAEPEQTAIAVLPFANLSSDPENEYFSDGLTAELIHALTKVENLRVIAASTILQLKGKPADVRQVGKQMQVRYVLEGSVRRSDDRFRIAARLVSAESGRYLWSENYDRKCEHVFAIQDEISRAIAATLRVQLGEAHGRSWKPEAYRLYLEAHYHAHKRTDEGLRRGIQLFERAIVEDPDCASAYAGLADSYALLAQYGIASPREVMDSARSNALQALALDNSLADAHVSLAFVQSVFDWNWKEAERHYRRALELNPGYAQAHHWYGGDFLVLLKRFDEALVHIRRALELDPLSLITMSSYTTILIMRREYDTAIRECRRMLDMDPHFYKAYLQMGRAYALKGDYETALPYFETARSLWDAPYITAVLAHAYASSGRIADARRICAELEQMAGHRHVPNHSLALLAVGFGDVPRALDLLERAAEDRETTVTMLGAYPVYDSLRSELRFQALLDRVGLP